MLMLTTTAIDIDEELLNRCLVLTMDERREQTRAIHALAAPEAARWKGLLAEHGSERHSGAASERAAAVEAVGGGQSVCRPADVPGRQDAHAARPR